MAAYYPEYFELELQRLREAYLDGTLTVIEYMLAVDRLQRIERDDDIDTVRGTNGRRLHN